MSLFVALLFAVIISGGTVLPISSSGHLALLSGIVSKALPSGTEYLFCGFSYLGVSLGILLYNRKEFLSISRSLRLSGTVPGKGLYEKKRIFLLVLMSTVPSVLSFILRKLSLRLAASVFWCGLALILQSVLLLYASRNDFGDRAEKHTAMKDALLIGFFGLLAALPGFSHIGILYSICVLLGFNRKYASLYTQLTMFFLLLSGFFLMFILAAGSGISWTYFPYCLLAVPVSIIVSRICIQLFDFMAQKFSLAIFGYYNIVLGLTALLLSQIS